MDQKIDNDLKECNIQGDYVGGDQTKNFYISMYQESERKFVVTHNTNIKPVSYFTGRETELQELRQRIEEGRKSVLVSGMGGIGKTQICRKLFEEYYISHDKGGDGLFRHIGYIEYSGDMDSSLMKCLRYKEQDSPELNKEAAWKELEDLASEGKLLLFVDNVDKSVGADAGLKRLNAIPGTVVLTSRRTSLGKEFRLLKIGFLSTEQCKKIYECIRYVDSGVPDEEIPDLEYIIDTLAARHTITIEFLAHLAETKCWGVKRLRDELQDKGFCLKYKDEDEMLVNIQESYETLYDLSTLTEAEQNILEAFSVFPYIPLAAETCNEWLLTDASVSEDDDILIGLYRKGWLQSGKVQDSYVLHPVFAQFIYTKCKPSIKTHLGLIESCQKSLELPESGSILECKQYIPFAESIVEKVDMKKDIEHVSFISSIAYLLHYIAEYQKAEELYEKVLRIEEVLGKEHSDTATNYNNLAGVYESQGEFRKAEKLYRRALYIGEKVLGKEHPDTAIICHNLSCVYKAQGEYEKARELCEKSLRICKSVMGESHLYTAKVYNHLAGIYQCQEDYEKAEELYEKSLQIRKDMRGEHHLDTARGYHNLASIYAIQGKYGRAISLYSKSLRIKERILGEDHPDTAKSYNDLAYVYDIQGKYGKAEKLYEKSLLIREKVLGENHPDTARGYNNLAYFHAKQGKYKNVLAYYIKAYKIFTLKLGMDNQDTQTVYWNIKYLYGELKIRDDFEQWLEEQMKE